VGSDISDHDLVVYALQGLGTEFDTFVTVFSMCQKSPSLNELKNLLLAHEARTLTNLRASSTSAVHLTVSPSEGVAYQPDPAAFYANTSKNKFNQTSLPSNQVFS
jgi:gag-polypeptide of LTR copia-type